MTVVCYREGVIAADRMTSTKDDLMPGYRTKIFKVGNILCGSAGSSNDAVLFREWVEKDRALTKPELADEHFEALLIDNGVLYRGNYKLSFVAIENKYDAIGNGDMVAFGAMYMGATAEQAVLAACHHVLGCGGGVDVLRLDASPSVEPSASAAATPKPSMGTMGT